VKQDKRLLKNAKPRLKTVAALSGVPWENCA
jgi:hypothetical protein